MCAQTRTELGELTPTQNDVEVVVNDDGAYPTVEKRTLEVDESGQEWVKIHGEYWKYPDEVDY